MSDHHRTKLEHAIINVLNAYHNIGGRHVNINNLPLAFNRLYTAIEALDTEHTQQQDTHTDTTPPCGGHVCNCNRDTHTHTHETHCTCWDDYALTNAQNGAHA